MNDNELLNIIAYSKVRGIGPAFFKKHLKSIKAFAGNLEVLASIGGKSILDEVKLNLQNAEELIRICDQLKIVILSLIDDSYPSTLLEIKDPPILLFARGNIKLMSKNLSIIGTTKSTNLGNKIASKISSYFTEDWSLCTIFQDGIDNKVINNLEGLNHQITGILPCGLNLVNTTSGEIQNLSKKILDNEGLIISEFEPNEKENKYLKTSVNRLQAGISRGVILIQSSDNEDTKYTLRTFSQLKRPIGVIYVEDTQFTESPSFTMNKILIEEKQKGLQKITNTKDINKIRTTEIIIIAGKSDYDLFQTEIKL